ncbi:MAG TPA: hypothetical protein VMF61_04635 [Candidatus Acidoferrales bacterium]|nr:hypothetical protein [Candidatus Acidoferrales bacterium]
MSAIKSGLAAAAAAVALAACGGNGGMMPSQNAANPGYAPNFLSNAAASKCDSLSPKFWDFGGSCVSDNLGAAGKKITLKKYQDITFTIDIGKNNAKAPEPFLVGDAVGNGDITGMAGKIKWTPYGGKDCTAGTGPTEKCPGHAFVYVDAINLGTKTVTLEGTPSISIIDTKGFNGATACFPAPLENFGKKYGLKWSTQAQAVLSKAPKGTKLNIPSGPESFPLPPGGVVIAMVCE